MPSIGRHPPASHCTVLSVASFFCGGTGADRFPATLRRSDQHLQQRKMIVHKSGRSNPSAAANPPTGPPVTLRNRSRECLRPRHS
jgi:hypothetical protein